MKNKLYLKMMKSHVLHRLATIGCGLLFGVITYAQDNIIDEVIWIVGDEAILRSEVEEERLRAQYEGQPIAGDPYCVIPRYDTIWVTRNRLSFVLSTETLFLHLAAQDSFITNNPNNLINNIVLCIGYYTK